MLQSTHNLDDVGIAGYFKESTEHEFYLQIIPAKVFPQGYIFILSVVDYFFAQKLISSFVLDGMAMLLFIISSLYLLRVTGNNIFGWVLFTAYCLISPTLLHPLPAADLLAMGIFTSSIGLLIYSLSSNQKPSLFLNLASGGLLGATFLLKYFYIAFLPTIPLVYLFYSYQTKEKQQLYRAFSFAILPIILLLYTAIKWILIEEIPYFDEKMAAEVFWDHLWYIDAFPLKSLIYFNENIVKWIQIVFPIPPFLIMVLINTVSVLILFIALTIWYKWVRQNGRFTRITGSVFAGILISNGLLLTYLSLTNPPETDWLDFWTFVMETRYYAPSQWCILMTFMLAVSSDKSELLSLISRLVLYTSLIISLGYVIFSNVNPKTDPTFPEYDYHKMYHLVDSIILKSEHPVIYTTNGTRIPDAVGAAFIDSEELLSLNTKIKDTLTCIYITEYPLGRKDSFQLLPEIDSAYEMRLIYTHNLWSMYMANLFPMAQATPPRAPLHEE